MDDLQRNVVSPLTERGHRDRKSVQAIEEATAERAPLEEVLPQAGDRLDPDLATVRRLRVTQASVA